MSWVKRTIEGVRIATGTRETDADLRLKIKQAIVQHERWLGIEATCVLPFQFRPYDSLNPGVLDTKVWENSTNVAVNETLKLVAQGANGQIETKAIRLDKEVAFLCVNVNAKSGGDLTKLSLDVSVDKDAKLEDGNMGTWVVADGLVAPFKPGDVVDLSHVTAKYFSLRLAIAASTLELTDMSIELYLIPSEAILPHLDRLKDSVAAMIYHKLWQDSVNNGNSPDTQRGWQRLYEAHLKSGLGAIEVVGGGRGSLMEKGGVKTTVTEKGHDDSVFDPHSAAGLRASTGSADILVFVREGEDGVRRVGLSYEFTTTGRFTYY